MSELTHQLSLPTPGAGSGIGPALAQHLLARPDFIDLMAAAFFDALNAQQFFYDKHAKEWHGEPDYKTRLAATLAVLAHMEGEPIKRIHHQITARTGAPGRSEEESLVAQLTQSPALRRKVEQSLRKATALAEAVEPNT